MNGDVARSMLDRRKLTIPQVIARMKGDNPAVAFGDKAVRAMIRRGDVEAVLVSGQYLVFEDSLERRLAQSVVKVHATAE